MKEFVVGEIVELEDKREFICYKKIQDSGKNYLFMISNFKPTEVFFAEEVLQGDVVSLRKIDDSEEKSRLLPLFGIELPSEKKQESKPDAEPPKTLNGEICSDGFCVGETLVLENKGKFFCVQKVENGGKEYLYLMSEHTPREFMFVEAIVTEGIWNVKVIHDPEKLRQLKAHIKKHPFEGFKQLFRERSKRKNATKK